MVVMMMIVERRMDSDDDDDKGERVMMKKHMERGRGGEGRRERGGHHDDDCCLEMALKGGRKIQGSSCYHLSHYTTLSSLSHLLSLQERKKKGTSLILIIIMGIQYLSLSISCGGVLLLLLWE